MQVHYINNKIVLIAPTNTRLELDAKPKASKIKKANDLLSAERTINSIHYGIDKRSARQAERKAKRK